MCVLWKKWNLSSKELKNRPSVACNFSWQLWQMNWKHKWLTKITVAVFVRCPDSGHGPLSCSWHVSGKTVGTAMSALKKNYIREILQIFFFLLGLHVLTKFLRTELLLAVSIWVYVWCFMTPLCQLVKWYQREELQLTDVTYSKLHTDVTCREKRITVLKTLVFFCPTCVLF